MGMAGSTNLKAQQEAQAVLRGRADDLVALIEKLESLKTHFEEIQKILQSMQLVTALTVKNKLLSQLGALLKNFPPLDSFRFLHGALREVEVQKASLQAFREDVAKRIDPAHWSEKYSQPQKRQAACEAVKWSLLHEWTNLAGEYDVLLNGLRDVRDSFTMGGRKAA